MSAFGNKQEKYNFKDRRGNKTTIIILSKIRLGILLMCYSINLRHKWNALKYLVQIYLLSILRTFQNSQANINLTILKML